MSDAIPSESFSEAPHGRGPAFCLRCHTPLPPAGPSDEGRRCPRCRLTYDPNNPETFVVRPMPLRWKFWLPGLALAVVAAVGSYVFILLTGQMGIALFFAVPFAAGAIIGYATRAENWVMVLLTAIATGLTVSWLVLMGVVGLFCGMSLAMLFVPAALVGALFGFGLGWLLRRALGLDYWGRRPFLPLLLLALSPLGVEAVENRFPCEPYAAEVRTDAVFAAGPRQTWGSIVYYEQVEHEPPWLLTLALPRPVAAEGSKAAVGDVQRCVYNNGSLVKQITRREEGRLLEFRVLEQHLHFERDVTLRFGSFTLEPIDAGHTRVVLTTRYDRHLRPAWLWEPMEREVIHTLHGHVLEGMRRRLPPAEPGPTSPAGGPREIAEARD
jgi:hypothetical protein